MAALGAAFDEWRALGFTTWRAVCRASGFSPSSIATFTLELLPTAVIGALAGGLIVLLAGFHARGSLARGALCAHAGCALAMPLGLLLCVTAWPWPLTLAADAALASLSAAMVWWFTRIRKATYAHGAARGVSRIPAAMRASENFSVYHLWNPHDCN
jgi:hypothetical protein